MRGVGQGGLLGLLLILLSACSPLVQGQSDPRSVRICIPYPNDDGGKTADDCLTAMQTLVQESNELTLDEDVTFECKYKGSNEDCLQGLKDEEVDLATFGGDYLFRGHHEHGFLAYVAEQYDQEEGDPLNHFYSIAIVKASQCKNVPPFSGSLGNLGDLQGKKSCHTSYHDSAGWILPIGYMMNRGILPTAKDLASARDLAYENDEAVDARAALEFFSDMCAPGTAKMGPSFNTNGNVTENSSMCNLCKPKKNGNTTGDPCSTDPDQNLYAGYFGAMQCLADGEGDVAFVKQGTFEAWRKDTSASDQSDQYRLLCNRGCLPLSEYKKCNLGEAPAKALVGRAGWDDDEVNKKILNLIADYDDFSALQEISGRKDFLWSGEATAARIVETPAKFDGADGFMKSYDQFDAVHALNEISICMPFDDETSATKDACESAMRGFSETIKDKLDTSAPVTFRCNARGSAEACMRAVQRGVRKGGDDFAVFGGDELYTAHEYYGLNAYAAEKYSEGNDVPLNEFYSVAVVDADQCDRGVFQGLSSLEGKYSCHGKYHDTAGWTLPIGYLMGGDTPLLDITDEQVEEAIEKSVTADAFAATTFFAQNGICAPGKTDNGPFEDEQGDGQPWDPICKKGCIGTSTEDISSNDVCKAIPDNAYTSDKGAFQCMVDKVQEGLEAVAFVRLDTYDKYKDDTDVNWGLKNNYKLLCDRGCVDLDPENAGCNLGESPARALVSNEDFVNSQLGKKFLDLASDPDSNFVAQTRNLNEDEDFLWSSGAISVQKIDDPSNFVGGFFKSYEQFGRVRKLSQQLVNFCFPFQPKSNQEFETGCTNIFKRFNRDNLRWKCKVGRDTEGCMQMVKNGTAQVTKFGGERLYTAYEEYGLQPILAEKYDLKGNGNPDDSSFATYKAVAVMKREACEDLITDLDETGYNHVFEGLADKKSCHTGYGKAAGWTLPIGTLMSLGLLSEKAKEAGVRPDAVRAASFFDGMCAPGTTKEGPSIPPAGQEGGGKYDELCTICKDGDCTEDSEYEGYQGALQCLLDEQGDVAWVKHTSALERPPSERDQLQILCPNAQGSLRCRNVDAWNECAYATAPGSAYVARAGWQETVAGKEVIKALTSAALDPVFLEVSSIDDFEDYPLQNSAVALKKVDDPSDFETVFGTEAAAAYRSIKEANGPESGDSNNKGSKNKDKGLTGGEIAGIVIACVIGVPVILALTILAVKKYKRGPSSGFSGMTLKNPFKKSVPPTYGEGYKVYNPQMDVNMGRVPPAMPAPADVSALRV